MKERGKTRSELKHEAILDAAKRAFLAYGVQGTSMDKLAEMADAAGKPCPAMVLIGSLPDSQDEAVETLGACKTIGAAHYIQASRYSTATEFDDMVERLSDLNRQLN